VQELNPVETTRFTGTRASWTFVYNFSIYSHTLFVGICVLNKKYTNTTIREFKDCCITDQNVIEFK